MGQTQLIPLNNMNLVSNSNIYYVRNEYTGAMVKFYVTDITIRQKYSFMLTR